MDEEEVDDGFFKPFRDGGGGASSMRPCERNCELYVLTVLGRFSGLRTSIEMDAFLLGMLVEELPPLADEEDLEPLTAVLLPLVSDPLSLPPASLDPFRGSFASLLLLPWLPFGDVE